MTKIVEIWSTYPPPYGGVSVHSMRLFGNLKGRINKITFKNFNGTFSDPKNSIFNVKSFIKEFIKLLFSSKRTIHLHSNNIYLWFLFSLFIWRHDIIITLHNQKLRNKLSFLEKCIRKIFLFKSKYIILNDNTLAEHIIRKYDISKAKFHILPAFIPPLPKEEIGLDEYFFSFRKKFSILLSTSAWKLYRKNNIDVYGIDQIIEAIYNLKKENIIVGLILVIPLVEDELYLSSLLERIKVYGLQEQILYINRHIPNAFEIWKLSDIYIRATSTDIEGLTIKEALYYGTHVIASDVVKRHEACLTYEFGNIEDFKNKILKTINKVNDKVEIKIKIDNPTNRILHLYNN